MALRMRLRATAAAKTQDLRIGKPFGIGLRGNVERLTGLARSDGRGIAWAPAQDSFQSWHEDISERLDL